MLLLNFRHHARKLAFYLVMLFIIIGSLMNIKQGLKAHFGFLHFPIKSWPRQTNILDLARSSPNRLIQQGFYVQFYLALKLKNKTVLNCIDNEPMVIRAKPFAFPDITLSQFRGRCLQSPRRIKQLESKAVRIAPGQPGYYFISSVQARIYQAYFIDENAFLFIPLLASKAVN